MDPKVSEDYKKQKKSDLLQAVKPVFISQTHTRATMQDIIDEAVVSRGALYAYFDNTEHDYLKLLQYEDQQDVFYLRSDSAGTSWRQVIRWILKQQKGIENIDQTLLLANSEFFLSTIYQQNKESYIS